MVGGDQGVGAELVREALVRIKLKQCHSLWESEDKLKAWVALVELYRCADTNVSVL